MTVNPLLPARLLASSMFLTLVLATSPAAVAQVIQQVESAEDITLTQQGQQPLGQAPGGPQFIDSIVAVVETDVILRSELDLAINGVRERIRAQGGAMPPEDLLERQVLERLIMRKLQVSNAMRTGIRVSDQEVDQAMVQVARQNGISITEMRSVIEAGGEDFGEFRNNLAEDIMTDRLMQRIVSGMTPIYRCRDRHSACFAGLLRRAVRHLAHHDQRP